LLLLPLVLPLARQSFLPADGCTGQSVHLPHWWFWHKGRAIVNGKIGINGVPQGIIGIGGFLPFGLDGFRAGSTQFLCA
jgi:hypothetical protein